MSLNEGLANTFERRRWLLFSLLALITIIATFGHLKPYQPPLWEGAGKDIDNRAWLREESFNLRGSDCFFVVDVENLFRPETLGALRRMVDELEELDYVSRIIWADRVPITNVFGLPEPLLPRVDASAEHFEDARRRTMEHPLIRGQLISLDGKTLLMPVTLDWLFVTSDEDCTSKLAEHARSLVAEHKDIQVRLTGNVPLYVEYKHALERNNRKYQLIAYSVSFVLAVWIFRGVSAVLLVIGAPGLGIYWTGGFLHLMHEPSNPLTNVVLPVLLMMVGLTDGIHLLVQIRKNRNQGQGSLEASSNALRRIGLACWLTSLTTAIGFASLLLARSDLIQGFGRACCVGVLLTFLAVVLVIPLMMSTRFGLRVDGVAEQNVAGRILDWAEGWIEGSLRRPYATSITAIVVTLAIAAVALQMRPDEKLSDSQPTSSEAYQALLHCDEVFGGLEFVRVTVRWPESTDRTSGEIVAAIRDVEELLGVEELLSEPLSLNDVLAAMPGDGDLTDRMAFVELLPAGLNQYFIDAEKRESRVIVRVRDMGILSYEPVFKRVEEGLLKLADKHAGFDFQLAGQPVVRGRELYRIVLDLATSLGTASFVILVVMGLAYRSWRIGLITIIPNLFPLAATGAVLYMTGHALTMASVCSFTVCLGIAVDDTIHFLTRYQQELADGYEVKEAIRRAVRSVGSALIITTIVLVSGFATVLTSDVASQRVFAAMACATISAALVGDLLFLPAMLVAFAGHRQQATTAKPDTVSKGRPATETHH